MAISYSQLKTECQTSAVAGVQNAYTAGNDQIVADLLNASNPAIAIDRGVIPAYEIIDATVQTEWTALSAAEKQRYQTLTGAGQVNSQSANTRATFQAMFAAGTTTRTNLTALLTRPGSRAEQLFGVGTALVHQDVAKARIS